MHLCRWYARCMVNRRPTYYCDHILLTCCKHFQAYLVTLLQSFKLKKSKITVVLGHLWQYAYWAYTFKGFELYVFYIYIGQCQLHHKSTLCVVGYCPADCRPEEMARSDGENPLGTATTYTSQTRYCQHKIATTKQVCCFVFNII